MGLVDLGLKGSGCWLYGFRIVGFPIHRQSFEQSGLGD